MKKLVKVFPLIAALALVSCKKDQSADQLVAQQDSTGTTTAAVVETPAAPVSGPLTTAALSESSYSFGKIKKGDQVEHVYEITNTGENPLIISEVKPACGCTAPDYTKDPIMPGQKGTITLKFDSASFDGMVSKQAEVFANVEKSPIVISFTADIQP
ncbi:hypothetical protein CO230_00970 [Chryseobacterium sp. 6424]|uniref:DUF1573 domain-containing protein n=1 Tax=Chryseobacterium sp. 6424 TaxID=2039166 RepID=UPI000EFC4DD7|nr:DUF1573 domain-containing protein [Chryseobacterium sp. 6424]AYO56830.1 hypothetical protein CO230_00970 [Chryseobacterium sp. 6424]